MADNIIKIPLSGPQIAMLEACERCTGGLCDTTVNRTLVALRKKGLVEPTNIKPDFGYNPRSHRAGGGNLQADWVLTDKGRTVLSQLEEGKREAAKWSKRFNKTLDENIAAARKRNSGMFGMGIF